MKTCPYCGEQIQDVATYCRYCQHYLDVKPSKVVAVKGFGGAQQGSTSSSTGARMLDVSPPKTIVLQPDGTGNQVLATLWYYQKRHFGGRSAQRWTFAMRGADGGRLDLFEKAAGELMYRGLVAYDASSKQYFLTDVGVIYCEAAEAVLAQVERWSVESEG